MSTLSEKEKKKEEWNCGLPNFKIYHKTTITIQSDSVRRIDIEVNRIDIESQK